MECSEADCVLLRGSFTFTSVVAIVDNLVCLTFKLLLTFKLGESLLYIVALWTQICFYHDDLVCYFSPIICLVSDLILHDKVFF